jgi:signal peptidase II
MILWKVIMVRQMQNYFSHIKAMLSFKNSLVLIALIILFLLIDQLSKFYMIELLKTEYSSINILPFFNFTLVYNTGVSFSFFNSIPWFFVLCFSLIATIFAVGILLSMMKKIGTVELLVLSLLIAGSCGNILDRIRYKSVVDFLHVYYAGYHFPVFNLADCMITLCGALILFTFVIKNSNQPENIK